MPNMTPFTLKPRLKSSLKWTSVPDELLKQIVTVCRENFPAKAKKGKFLATGHIYAEEILFQLGYLENNRVRQLNFNVSVQFNPRKDNALKMIHLALDCAASLMSNHFEEDDEEGPTEWEAIAVEGRTVYFCMTTENTELESEADRLLGQHADDLVKETDLIDLDEDDDSGERGH